MRFITALLILLNISAVAQANSSQLQVGLGYAKQRYNSPSFKNSTNDSRGHFDFNSIELRAAWFFLNKDPFRLGLEAQFHKSLENHDSTLGTIGFQELALNFILNIKFWQNLCGEAGVTISNVTEPRKDFENSSGLGILYGVTYLVNDNWELRLRREDRTSINSYDIQPGYSFSVSYLF